jgi:D-amino-acid oxidase
MTSESPDVLVIGAGVSGLTTAVCLAEAGLTVDVAAADPPQQTTSAAAGAIWGPHLVGMDERVTRWGRLTMRTLTGLAADPATGVRLASGIVATAKNGDDPPGLVTDACAAIEPGRAGQRGREGQDAGDAGRAGAARRCEPGELPPGFASGWRLTVPVVAMPVYLGYLLARLERAGGAVRQAEFGSLVHAAAATSAPVIVNCTGTGARAIVPDPDVEPVRGQVVVVSNPGIEEFFVGLGAADDDVSYYFPHGDLVVLGGTEERGDWRRDPDPATAARILRRCAAAEPRLTGMTVLTHRVGLRPWRPAVRVEAEDLEGPGGRRLLHNYGHGGAGVSLSWGCARDVAEAVLG